MRSKTPSPLLLFFGLSYLLFWLLLGVTGALIALKLPGGLVTGMKNLCAWSPTFALLLLFRRLYPQTTLRSFLRDRFAHAVNPLVFIALLLLQAAIIAAAVAAYSLATTASLAAVTLAPAAALPSALLINATSGPLGEELGWRGYALGALQRNHSPFVATLVLGLVWGFWHLPLWFLSGFTGGRLVSYVVFFLIGIVSLSFLITVFYHRHPTILVPMWIHFLFNFLMALFTVELLGLLRYTAILYLIVAVVAIWWDRRHLFAPAGETELPPAAAA